MEIRRAKICDIADIYTLYSDHRNERLCGGRVDYDYADFKQYIKSQKVDLIVACEQGHVIGYALIYDHDNWGYMDSFCIDRTYRNRGIGKAFITKLTKFKKRWITFEACFNPNDKTLAKFLNSNNFKSDTTMLYQWTYRCR